MLALHGRAVTTAFDAAAGALADLMGLHSGRARVIGFPTASSSIVPSLLAELGREHGGIAVSYHEDEPPEAVDAVRSGVADVAITFSYPGDRDDPHLDSAQGLTVTTLWADEMLLALPATHPAAQEERVSMESLRGETWIAGCPRCRGHLLEVAEAAGFAPSIAYETDNFGAVLGMVAAGIGVALVPQLALDSVKVPGGVALRPTARGDHRSIHIVTGFGAERVPAVKAVLSAASSLDGDRFGLRPVENRRES